MSDSLDIRQQHVVIYYVYGFGVVLALSLVYGALVQHRPASDILVMLAIFITLFAAMYLA